MSDSQDSNATPATEAKTNKKTTVYNKVTMTDGRVVEFPGTRWVDKTVTVDEAAGKVSVRFDFVNGETRTIDADELAPRLQLQAIGHGLSQKIGDEWSDVKTKGGGVEDVVLTCDEIMARLRAGDWTVPSEGGDSMAGASIVIKAICEATGKDVAFVKDFLNKKLEAAKAKGEKLSRQELYNSFRNPASKTGAIIKRLEEEKLAKSTKVQAADLLAEMA